MTLVLFIYFYGFFHFSSIFWIITIKIKISAIILTFEEGHFYNIQYRKNVCCKFGNFIFQFLEWESKIVTGTFVFLRPDFLKSLRALFPFYGYFFPSIFWRAMSKVLRVLFSLFFTGIFADLTGTFYKSFTGKKKFDEKKKHCPRKAYGAGPRRDIVGA